MLILVSGVVVALIARFAWRLWQLDAPAPHKGVPYDGGKPDDKGVPYGTAVAEP